MKKIFKNICEYVLPLAIVMCLTMQAFAGYSGLDTGTYKGSKTIHFSVAVASTTTAAVFAVATYSSSFDTLDGMEFVVQGTTTVYICDTASFDTGVSTAPMTNVRQLTAGEKYATGGRNIDTIYARTEKATAQNGIITGTIWGH